MKPIHVLVAALILSIGTPMPSSSQNAQKKENKTQTAKPKKPSKASKLSTNPASKTQPAVTKETTSPILDPGNGGLQRRSSDVRVPNEPVRPIVLKDQKSPGLALGLSALLPGCGQYYNGDYMKGAIQTGIFATGVVVALTLGTESSYSSNAYTDYGYYGTYTYYRPETEEWNSAWLYVGIGVAAGAWLWSVIDAPISASSMNDEDRGEQYGHLLEMNNPSYAVGLDIAPTHHGTDLNLTVHF